MSKRTPLFEEHKKLNGRIVDFGGWELPVQYTGVIDEHVACRTACGLFDVSHMGEFFVDGPGSVDFVNFLVTNDVSKISVLQAQYTVMCFETGGIVDDLVIYKRGPEKILLVVNAANIDKDFAWVSKQLEANRSKFPNVKLSNESARYSQIAVQGPRAAEIVQKLTKANLSEVKTYWFCESTVLDSIPAIIARTGYTGEDGFEIYAAWDAAPQIWRALLEVGTPLGMKPCGLGARDTLRLEMKYPLYGHELSDTTNPLEAGLGWVVKLDKPDFIGKSALVENKAKGFSRALVGIKLIERGIPRQGYPVKSADGIAIGELTSGTQSPSLKEPIGIAYIKTANASVGSIVGVEIRGQIVKAEVVKTPFYQKKKP